MLRIVPTQSAAQAKSYYSHSDYYTEDQELPGLWRGRGAERLGLDAKVEKHQFDALCDNRHPATGGRLTARTDKNRTVGYDFNFHAPKSLSLLHAVSGDPKLLTAFQQSVDETMQLIEADMQTRVRKGYKYRDRGTGEMAWARFDHFTARPIDGIPDPHLHSHCFAFNMTFDREEGRWKAGQFRNLKRDAPFYQSVFHANLTARLRELGVPLEKTAHGWEIAGFRRATLEKFSRRTQRIEEIAKAKGIADPKLKDELGAKTREAKAKDLSLSELRRLWAEKLDAGEREVLGRLATSPEAAASVGLEAKDALDFACRHLFERNSVVAERKLLAEMLSAGLGRFSLDEARQAMAESDLIVREVRGQRLATTPSVLAEEQSLIDFARDGRGVCEPLGPASHTFVDGDLNAGQKAAVRHVLGSRDRVIVIRGAAGSGKTALMQETANAIEKHGARVFAFAPSADASRGVLRQEGFRDADTVARLLVDSELQDSTRGQVLWIDEAGLLGTRQMKQVFDLAARNDCRVILSGDRKQHGSVERGAVLKILEEQAGLKVAELTEIRRQKGEYMAAVRLLSDGETKAGFDKLDALGWVREIADCERYQQMAADYVGTVRGGQTALVVSPTHAEGDRVTATIRQTLRGVGRLSGAEHEVATLSRVDLTEAQRGKAGSYCPGDVLQFHQNAKGGFHMGQRLVVEEGQALPVDQAERFQAFRPGKLTLAVGDRLRVTKGGQSKDGHKLENGSLFTLAGFTRRGDLKLGNGWVIDKNYGHIAHGYVVTSHASQGKTVDRVFIGQSSLSWPATSREQFYVSASRGRQQVTIYTDDKQALRDAIDRSDERLSATELVGRDQHRDSVRQRLNFRRNRWPKPQRSPARPERKEVVRD